MSCMQHKVNSEVNFDNFEIRVFLFLDQLPYQD